MSVIDIDNNLGNRDIVPNYYCQQINFWLILCKEYYILVQ